MRKKKVGIKEKIKSYYYDITKRTIEAHLAQDRDFYKSLSADTQFAIFVRSQIITMSHLLAHLQGSSVELYSTPSTGGSPSSSLEGAFWKIITFRTYLQLLLLLLLLLLFNLKAVPTYTGDSIEEANIPSEFFGQPEYHQGDVEESGPSGKCVTLVFSHSFMLTSIWC